MTLVRTAVAALSLIASSAWADLRTYDVPPQFQQEIYNALARVLSPEGQPTQGRVQLLPSGQILVNASPETLTQIEAVLRSIRTQPVAETPRAELRYWVVLGSRPPGGASDAVGSPVPPALDDVLDELSRLHGNLSFRVIGTAALKTESGQAGEIGGAAGLFVEQTAYVQGDTLSAEIGMFLRAVSDNPVSVELRTTLRRGEFVVLGESELKDGDIEGPAFFIVHWPD